MFNGIVNRSRHYGVLDILVVLESRSTVSFCYFERGILHDFSVGIQSIHFRLVSIGHGQEGASDDQQVGNILELQLKKRPSVAQEMVRLVVLVTLPHV